MKTNRTISPAIVAHALGPVLALWGQAQPTIELLLNDPQQALGRPLAARAMTRSVPDGIAVIDVRGLLVKDESILTDLGLASSVLAIAAEVQKAAANPAVRGIFMIVDSPGGSAAGMSEAAAIIRAARQIKPIRAHTEGVMASGAYFLSCSANSVTTCEMGIVGSIGTYATLVDFSKMADAAGIKVHIVKAGKFKGTGIPGTPITDEQLTEIQRTTDGLNDCFIQAIMAGRGMNEAQVREWADGRVHVGTAAAQLGLTDKTFATTADSLRISQRAFPPRRQHRER